MISDFLAAVPWPEFFYIGVPAFGLGVITGRFWGRPNHGEMR